MPTSKLKTKGGENKKKCNTHAKTDHFPHLPQHELEAFARCLLPSIEAFFETDEGQQAFAEWERQQEE